MPIHPKFNRTAGVGILGGAILLSGCGEPPGAVENGEAVVIARNCVVIDREAGPAFRWSFYDFNRDFAQFSLQVRGVEVDNSTFGTQVFQGDYSVKISELPEGDGRTRAIEMYEKLPAELKCPRPAFKK